MNLIEELQYRIDMELYSIDDLDSEATEIILKSAVLFLKKEKRDIDFKNALKSVTEKLIAMPKEEFKALIESHKPSYHDVGIKAHLMNDYYLFAGLHYAEGGGAKDFQGTFYTIDEAKQFFVEHAQDISGGSTLYNWGHITDEKFNILEYCEIYTGKKLPVWDKYNSEE